MGFKDKLSDFYMNKVIKPTDTSFPSGMIRSYAVELKGAVDAHMLAEVMKHDTLLRSGTVNVERITIHVNTPGGSIVNGMKIVRIIEKWAEHYEIVTMASGYIASMGQVIFMVGDKRIALRGATILVHDGCWMHNDSMSNYEQRYTKRRLMRMYKGLGDEMMTYSRKRGMRLTKKHKQMLKDDQDVFLTASQAKKVGIATHVGG